MVGLIAVFGFSIRLTVDGVVDQAPEIGPQLSAGIDTLGEWLDETGISIDDGNDLVDTGHDVGSWLVRRLAASLSSVFSSAIAFLAGVLIGLFFLYYVLADWDQLVEWLAGHMGVAPALGRDIR